MHRVYFNFNEKHKSTKSSYMYQILCKFKTIFSLSPPPPPSLLFYRKINIKKISCPQIYRYDKAASRLFGFDFYRPIYFATLHMYV